MERWRPRRRSRPVRWRWRSEPAHDAARGYRGRLLESYHAQKAFWDETIASYRGTIVQALREVADALAAQDRLVEQRTAQEAQVAALRNAVGLSLARYDTGLTNYIEVLDAEELL